MGDDKGCMLWETVKKLNRSQALVLVGLLPLVEQPADGGIQLRREKPRQGFEMHTLKVLHIFFEGGMAACTDGGTTMDLLLRSARW